MQPEASSERRCIGVRAFARHLAGVFACLLIAGSASFAQGDRTVSIAGKVVDNATGLPLVGVNVYLTGTTLGSVTNRDGAFEIASIPPGSYTLVASMVGFVRRTHKADFTSAEIEPILFRLEEEVHQLEAISVVGRAPKDWKRMLDEFRKRFLGSGPNAPHCRLINPEVLDLAYSSREDKLMARSLQPLRLENHALGYLLAVDLDTLIATDLRWEYRGLVRFEEMQPANRRQAERWRRNRKEAYTGSPAHFLSALIRDRLRPEGFRMHAVAQPGDGWETEQDARELEGLLQPGASEYVYVLRGPVVLWVVYGDNGVVQTDRPMYRDRRTSDLRWNEPTKSRRRGSWIRITRPYVPVNPQGWMYVEDGLLRYGEWAQIRIADELPLDYVVGR